MKGVVGTCVTCFKVILRDILKTLKLVSSEGMFHLALYVITNYVLLLINRNKAD